MAKFKAQQGGLLPYYWLSGKLYNHNDNGLPVVPTFSQAMDYSVVLIDGIRVNVTKKGVFGFRFKDHVKRLLKGWRQMNLQCNLTERQILKGLVDCVEANLKYLKSKRELQSIYVRPKIYHTDPVVKPFYGHQVEVVIECFPFGNYLPSGGISATLADTIRAGRYSHYATKGMGKYPEYGMIRESGAGKYDDVFQLGIGKGGKLIFTEGTTSNLFFVKNGKLFTAGTDDFILHGITRDSVIKMAKFLKIQVVEGEIGLSECLESEEIFVTGTASFIGPVTQLGRYKLGIGTVTRKLSALFEKVREGRVKEFAHWLTKFNV